MKEVGQQYPGVFCAPEKRYDNNSAGKFVCSVDARKAPKKWYGVWQVAKIGPSHL